ETKSVSVTIAGYEMVNKSYQMLRLNNLPESETFNSHTSNALQKLSVTPVGNALSISLPPMSITSVLLHHRSDEPVTGIQNQGEPSLLKVYRDLRLHSPELTVEIHASGKASLYLQDLNGREIKSLLSDGYINGMYQETVSLSPFPKGVYFLKLNMNGRTEYRKILH